MADEATDLEELTLGEEARQVLLWRLRELRRLGIRDRDRRRALALDLAVDLGYVRHLTAELGYDEEQVWALVG